MDTFATEKQKADSRLLEISTSIDSFEGYDDLHAGRIAEIADIIAQKLSVADRDRFFLRQAALVHDIGELVMNRSYILSNGALNDSESVDMQRHPVIGEQEASRRGLSRSVQLFVRWHHEWWNGSGYPDALENFQIPLAARILRVADTYASLTGKRPYREALSIADAEKYLIEWAGIEFDPQVVKTFLAIEKTSEPETSETAQFDLAIF